ncbi:MAG: aminotransferase class V-fold PLP-dependent enzyme [Saprospiraceae bacterium]|nr:aminotransferase class V-fold PLP-dependent enzyme [Saprospiraceae bacterium]
MNQRRRFLRNAGAYSLSAIAGRLILPEVANDLVHHVRRIESMPLDTQIKDEAFWESVKQAYTVSPTIMNLNNGGVSPQPRVVQEAVERYNKLSNEAPSYYMWRILDKGREPLRSRVADLAGCSAEEIAFNRNTSEALETIIFGLRLEAGDEVVLSKLDYPNMMNAWRQREHRDGIVLKWIEPEFPMESDEEIIRLYTDQFTDKTRIVHLTHMVNWMGQVIPVKKIADAAHERGIEVVVDGAHSFAHLDFEIRDLNCDYFGTSLHKWLCAPFGSGLIYVRKEKIKSLYPLLAAPDPEEEDIRKFEHLGTRSFAIEQAIGQALDFHLMIGPERKAERLWMLKNYWCERVSELNNVSIGTSLNRDYGGAIALLRIEGQSPQDVGNALMNDHGIHTVSIDYFNVQGVRITPNVYTLTSDLDRLVGAIKEIAGA